MKIRIAGVIAAALLALGLPLGQPAQAQDDNCIADAIEGQRQPYQTVIFTNRCNQLVQIDLCLKVSDRTAVEYMSVYVGPKALAKLGIALNPSTSYRYVYNWCWGTGCPNSQPDCSQTEDTPEPQGPRRL